MTRLTRGIALTLFVYSVIFVYIYHTQHGDITLHTRDLAFSLWITGLVMTLAFVVVVDIRTSNVQIKVSQVPSQAGVPRIVSTMAFSFKKYTLQKNPLLNVPVQAILTSPWGVMPPTVRAAAHPIYSLRRTAQRREELSKYEKTLASAFNGASLE